MRACPTQAIRVRRGHAVMLEDRCIDCGECIKVCTKRAVLPLTGSLADLSKFDVTIAIPSPALYAQFDTELSPGVVLEALNQCGFDDAASLSPSCAAVTAAIEMYLAEYRGQYPLISSFCPTVVRLIQVKYPDLVEQLLPILAPREVAAREAKLRKAEETGLPLHRIGAVYITPCPAKMVSIVDHPGMEKSYLDSAVSINDLFHVLATAIPKVQHAGGAARKIETASGLSWAFLRGLPSSLPAEDTMSVAGLPNVVRILDDIEKGKLRRYTFIECHACPEGCVSGALTVQNPYVARVRVIRLTQSLGDDPVIDREEVLQRYQAGDYLMKLRIEARPLIPLDTEISRAIAKMKESERIRSNLLGIDCGACGAPSCKAFAEDVVLGKAEEGQCVFVRQREIESLVKELALRVCAQSRTSRPPSEEYT
jgi:Fe-S-cluster-containing hydrogenase component 2